MLRMAPSCGATPSSTERRRRAVHSRATVPAASRRTDEPGWHGRSRPPAPARRHARPAQPRCPTCSASARGRSVRAARVPGGPSPPRRLPRCGSTCRRPRHVDGGVADQVRGGPPGSPGRRSRSSCRVTRARGVARRPARGVGGARTGSVVDVLRADGRATGRGRPRVARRTASPTTLRPTLRAEADAGGHRGRARPGGAGRPLRARWPAAATRRRLELAADVVLAAGVPAGRADARPTQLAARRVRRSQPILDRGLAGRAARPMPTPRAALSVWCSMICFRDLAWAPHRRAETRRRTCCGPALSRAGGAALRAGGAEPGGFAAWLSGDGAPALVRGRAALDRRPGLLDGRVCCSRCWRAGVSPSHWRATLARLPRRRHRP